MEEMQNLGILDNQYVLISKKDEDAFNFYYVGRDNQNQNDFIIEIRTNQINKDNNKKINNIPANDINILNTLNNANSPFILHYIRNRNGPLVLQNQPPINVHYTIFENASKFNLGNYLNKEGFSERHSKLIFKKILTGVQAIHNSNICHRNISPWHIMFDNENYNPKIYCFNLSRLNANNLQEKVLFNKHYVPPEAISFKQYDGFKYDIFSLGHLLFNLVTGQLGFNMALPEDQFYKFISRNDYEKYWGSKQFPGLNLSDSFKDLFLRMVAYAPDKRPTIDEVLNSEWMQDLNNLTQQQMEALENEVRAELHNREAQFQRNEENQENQE